MAALGIARARAGTKAGGRERSPGGHGIGGPNSGNKSGRQLHNGRKRSPGGRGIGGPNNGNRSGRQVHTVARPPSPTTCSLTLLPAEAMCRTFDLSAILAPIAGDSGWPRPRSVEQAARLLAETRCRHTFCTKAANWTGHNFLSQNLYRISILSNLR